MAILSNTVAPVTSGDALTFRLTAETFDEAGAPSWDVRVDLGSAKNTADLDDADRLTIYEVGAFVGRFAALSTVTGLGTVASPLLFSVRTDDGWEGLKYRLFDRTVEIDQVLPARWMLGDWRRSSMPANTSGAVSRGSGQSTAVVLDRACKLVGFTCANANLGTVLAVAGSSMIIRVVRQPKAGGAADAPVRIGTVLVGESNVSKPSEAEPVFSLGDLVYVDILTDSSFTSTTVAPSVRLEFEEILP